jgi:hypothetical protein
MPVFPWRFIDSLLGRSRPGDEQPATADDLSADVSRMAERIEADIAAMKHLGKDPSEALGLWSRSMLRRRAPAPNGRSRRDANVQLGAVSGAIRVVIQHIHDAFANRDVATGQGLALRLRPLESEIASPLYSLDEQSVVRAQLNRTLEELESLDAPVDTTELIARIVQALAPRER